MEVFKNTSTIEQFSSLYERFLEAGDDRVENMLFMSSPWPILAICCLYLYFVLSFGPKYMKDRKPFSLKRIMIVYNLLQVIFNAWLFIHSLDLWVRYYGWGLSCLKLRPPEAGPGDLVSVARVCHLYLLNKVVDLLDTIFFVLKKKNDKITTLHVFHHAVMPFSCWFGVKFHPGGNLSFFGLPNLFVHIWMYLYYLVAIMGPQYQKYIWWKRHLTEMQLIQFGMVGLYLGYVSHACNLHRFFTYWIVTLDIIFILLFTDFYIKSYRKRNNPSTKTKEAIKAD